MAVSVQCSMAILYIFLFILAGVSKRGSVSISRVRSIVQRRSYDYLALIPVKYLMSDQDCTIQTPASTNYTHKKALTLHRVHPTHLPPNSYFTLKHQTITMHCLPSFIPFLCLPLSIINCNFCLYYRIVKVTLNP